VFFFLENSNRNLFSDATLSITQRPKSRAREVRNKTLTDRSHALSDSIDKTLQHVKPLGTSNNLRVESDDDKSERELSESLKSATFNQTHTLSHGKFLPTQSPALNRTSFRSNDEDLKPLKTGALDRTVRLNKDMDDLPKANTRLPAIDKSSMNNTRLDRTSSQPLRKKQDSDEDKSSEEEQQQTKSLNRKPERLSPPLRNDRRSSPRPRRKDDDDESDDNKRKQPSSPRKIPMSETLNRKTRQSIPSDEDEDQEEEEDDEEEDNRRLSSRQTRPKQQPPPPTAARRSSLPPQTRSGAPSSSTRDGNQTIGSKPADGVRGSFRSQATKTLAKPNTTTSNNDLTKKETPASQPGFFSRLFGAKSTPPPSQPPPPPPQPQSAPATNTNSRACSIM